MTGSRNPVLPICFTRDDVRTKNETSATIHARIQRALKRDEILLLKKGLYMKTHQYLHEADKTKLTEYIASQICEPSYISLEYALEKHGLLLLKPSRTAITSITTKTTRAFTNITGTYVYANIKLQLFHLGREKAYFQGKPYYIATKAKAFFDYCYLHSDLPRRNKKLLKYELFEKHGFQWDTFTEKDFQEFDTYVWKSNSAKMMNIWYILKEYYDKKKIDAEFAVWRRELLGQEDLPLC